MKIKPSKLFIFFLSFFIGFLGTAHAETIRLRPQAQTVSIVLMPEEVGYESGGSKPAFRATFNIKWGAYNKTITTPRKSGGEAVVVRFSDFDGSGYNIEINTKGRTRYVGYFQGANIEQIRENYPYATIYTCGGTISC